jgi:hypothetical protein
VLTEREVSIEDIAAFVERHIAGWYEVQDDAGLVRSLVVYDADRDALERAWRYLEPAFAERNSAQGAARASQAYERHLRGLEVDLGEWERLAELSVESGTRPVLHVLNVNEQQAPSLEMVCAELIGQPPFLAHLRMDEIYNLHYRKMFPLKQDFLRRLHEINVGQRG